MLIRVFEIPPPSGNFHFGGGEPQQFVEVDWFRDEQNMMETDEGRTYLEQFIKAKNYFDPDKPYLVLHPTAPMTINYSAP